MQFKNLEGNNIKAFPEPQKGNHKLIIEFKQVRPFNKFINNISDLTGHKGFKINIANRKSLRSLILSDLDVNDFLNIYEYFKEQTEEVL